MRITRNFFIHNGSLHWWLWCFSLVFLAGLLVDGEDAAYAARAGWRGKKSSQSSSSVRRLERAAATTGKRVALVIGNSNYIVPGDRLFNPVNDASDISRELEGFGFEVETLTDLGNEAMRNAITDFGRRASNADVALFYYAGHGIQSKSQNYLIPVDAKLPSEARLEFETVNLNLPLAELENAQSKVNIVMLDACRNNSFGGSFRGRQRGLATPGGIPEGTVIVYATGPGKLSEDEGSNGRNGLFTEGVLKAFRDSNDLSLDAVLTTASRHVETVSNGGQSPHVNGPETLKKDFYFAGSAAGNAGRDAAESARLADIERRNREADARLKAKQAELDAIERRRLAAEEQARLAEAAARRKQAAADAVVVPEERPQPPVLEAVRCDYCPEMVDIPAGSFKMGSPESEKDRSSDEGPVHRVQVKAFRMGKYEVTRGQFRSFVDATSYKTTAEQGNGCYGWTGSTWEQKPEFNWLSPGFAQEDNHPVVCVSWNDAVAYTEWLAKETGEPYRLPSEAEWEYAARAGTTTARYWGDGISHQYANYGKDECCGPLASGKDRWEFTAPVGSFAANSFGLYDMLGNVWEWNQDKWHGNYDGAPTDGSAWESGDGSSRLLRGCSWNGDPDNCRAAYRFNGTNPNDVNGYRVVFRVAGRAF